MKRISQVVWKGGDNSFKLKLANRNVAGIVTPSPLETVTAMRVEVAEEEQAGQDRSDEPVMVAGLTVNRDEQGLPLDWWDADLDQGEVKIQLGVWLEENDIPIGDYTVRIISYDLINTNGIYWSSHKRRDLTINLVV